MNQRAPSQTAPPSGNPAPTTVAVPGLTLDLWHLGQQICRAYHREFPDEFARYGDAAAAWCVHDMQHLLFWAAGEVNGHFAMNPQVMWLAGVLTARDFPLDRLARGLDIAAEVVLAQVTGDPGIDLARVLTAAAQCVRGQCQSPTTD